MHCVPPLQRKKQRPKRQKLETHHVPPRHYFTLGIATNSLSSGSSHFPISKRKKTQNLQSHNPCNHGVHFNPKHHHPSFPSFPQALRQVPQNPHPHSSPPPNLSIPIPPFTPSKRRYPPRSCHVQIVTQIANIHNSSLPMSYPPHRSFCYPIVGFFGFIWIWETLGFLCDQIWAKLLLLLLLFSCVCSGFSFFM
jgi:hypothetical protein